MPFDRATAAQIYSQIHKDKDGLISEEEFIRIWRNSEDSFIDQIARNNAEIQKAQEQKKQIEIKIREMLALEKRGQGFRDSSLTLNVIDAQNILYDQTIVNVIFRDQQYTTEKGETAFPIYNCPFKISGVDVKDVIELLVTALEPQSEED